MLRYVYDDILIAVSSIYSSILSEEAFKGCADAYFVYWYAEMIIIFLHFSQ